MRVTGTLAVLLILAACAGEVPDARMSQRGVGFGSPADLLTPEPVQTGPIVPGGRISQEGGASFDGQLGSADSTTVEAEALPQVEIDVNNPGISDEQDFAAVSSRETIESDRARLEAQREAYQVIEPEALPTRKGSTGPSIVEFALSTTNPVGQRLYERGILDTPARFSRNCAKYASSDIAQAAFLKAGGPERDRYGLDPDGDGFACYWDPEPFRAALGGQ